MARSTAPGLRNEVPDRGFDSTQISGLLSGMRVFPYDGLILGAQAGFFKQSKAFGLVIVAAGVPAYRSSLIAV